MEKMEVFLYSAPEDEPMLQKLVKQLWVFEHQGLITLWHNYALLPGADREREIADHFARAAFIFLLVSPDFMNADYGYGYQVQEALKRHQQGKTRVIPVIVRPVLWQEAPFGHLQALPKGAVPMTDGRWHSPDDALYSVVEGFKQALEEKGLTVDSPFFSEPVETEQDLPATDRSPALSLPFLLTHWGALGVLISVTLGLDLITFLQNDPRLWVFLQRYPWLVAGVLLITGGIPLLLLRRTKNPRFQKINITVLERRGERLYHLLTHRAFSLLVPATTTTLFLALLLLVLVRPAWCPVQLCTAPPITSATNPKGTHDANLDLYLVTQQSNFFELPGSLSAYTIHNLPTTIAAVNSDNTQALPYRLVFSVTNRNETGYSIYIDQVELVILGVPKLANPLHVWHASSLAYTTSPYYVIYRGEEAESVLPADYESAPDATGVHQQVGAGETETLDLQIIPAPHIQADVQFQVRVVYRLSNEAQDQSLTLPQHFEVVFSNASNWHVQTF